MFKYLFFLIILVYVKTLPFPCSGGTSHDCINNSYASSGKNCFWYSDQAFCREVDCKYFSQCECDGNCQWDDSTNKCEAK